MRSISDPKTPGAGAPATTWHSPVPYLFGGLAAMLSLIAFALLILACSYLRLSEERDDDEDNNMDSNTGGEKVYEEKILVIMAGHDSATFLATPVSGKASSFVVANGNCVQANCGCKIEKPKVMDKTTDQSILS